MTQGEEKAYCCIFATQEEQSLVTYFKNRNRYAYNIKYKII